MLLTLHAHLTALRCAHGLQLLTLFPVDVQTRVMHAHAATSHGTEAHGLVLLRTQLTIHQNQIHVLPPSLSLAEDITVLEIDRDPQTNHYFSPPNPIPQQSTANFLRYKTCKLARRFPVLTA
eukprot:443142-Rhodomonas_salina.2